MLIVHAEKKSVKSTDVICWNRDNRFFCNKNNKKINKNKCWICRFFVNSTNESVECTE